MGSVVSSLKISSTGLPSSFSMVAMASLLSYDGTLSQSFCSSTMALGERMSGRIDRAWPSLMKNGPMKTRQEGEADEPSHEWVGESTVGQSGMWMKMNRNIG